MLSIGIGTEMSAPHVPHPHQQPIVDYSNLNHIMVIIVEFIALLIRAL
jgi:hypothetical protein